jgi:hypothetical protein
MNAVSVPVPWLKIEAGEQRYPYWSVTRIEYADPGDTLIYVHFEDERGAPVRDVGVRQAWPDDSVVLYSQEGGDKEGRADLPMSHDGGFYPERGEVGPYGVVPVDPGDSVSGFGLPNFHHVRYDVYLRRVLAPLPVPTGEGKDRELRAVLLGAAESLAAQLRSLG